MTIKMFRLVLGPHMQLLVHKEGGYISALVRGDTDELQGNKRWEEGGVGEDGCEAVVGEG